MRYCLNHSSTRVFVHWKLRLRNFLMDSVLISLQRVTPTFSPLGCIWGLGLSKGDVVPFSSSSPTSSVSESCACLFETLRSSSKGLWGIDDLSEVRSVTMLISGSILGTAADFFFLRELSSWCFVNSPGTPPSTKRCCFIGSLSLACACA